MNNHRNLAALVLLLLCCGCGDSDLPSTLAPSDFDKQEMEAAIQRARQEVDDFIREFEAGNGDKFSVKVPITDGEYTEHFWLTDLKYENGEFSGLIGNEPGYVTTVQFGQRWTVQKMEISDWMFRRDGKIHGNYTMRPLLKTLPEEEAEAMRSMLAEP